MHGLLQWNVLQRIYFHRHCKTFKSSAVLSLPKIFPSKGPKLPSFIQKSLSYEKKTAIVDHNGIFTYGDLARSAVKLSQQLQTRCSLQGERIAFITPNDASYVISQWSAWLCGAICVPLCKTHPPSELSHVLENCRPKIVISTPEYSNVMDELSRSVGAEHWTLSQKFTASAGLADLGDFNNKMLLHDDAMLIYTSGTTGRPKGALWTHTALENQVASMLLSWEWSCDDTILHVLPLHHWHGIVNALMCPLSIGGTIVMKNKFDAAEVWEHLLGEVNDDPDISVFMAVPTIYTKLLQHFEQNMGEKMEEIAEKCGRIRLMVSGSSALPVPIFERWKKLTSHGLLERYGMSEVGMALTNSYRGTRTPGTVGLPFPGTEAKVLSDGQQIIVHASSDRITEMEEVKGQHGELLIKGSIFKEYWGNPQATKDEFADGWFKTGDTAAFQNGSFKIVGRSSVDIIKSGGYKISALDVERTLLGHENIAEVAILGVPDEIWGQRVGAIISLKNPSKVLTLEDVKDFCAPLISPYCTPTLIYIVPEIPKNAMGKVNKKKMVELFDDRVE